MRRLVLVLLVAGAGAGHAAPMVSSRNWQLAIEALQCSEARLGIEARIRYTGPKGPVEAPVMRIAEATSRHYAPRGLVWKQGAKPLAQWLSAGGLANLQSEDVGAVLVRFELDGATAPLQLEFGDIAPVPLTRNADGSAPLCARVLKRGEIRTVRPRPAGTRKVAMRVYRSAYPCVDAAGARRTVEAQYPPHPPAQLLILGRGYLPAARRALAADFPQYATSRHFACNWGEHRSPAGNPLDSVGLYELRACGR